MSATRNGKIARLPKPIRDDLGRRIENGEQGKELVEWLNALPGVQDVLKEQFGGRPVNEQNLSEWKQGGYPEWLRQEEIRSLVSKLAEQSDDLDDAADGQEISDCFAGVLGAELARLATTLLEKETDPEKRWQRLCEVHRELSRLRRDDHRAVRTLIKRQNWIRKTERQDEEAARLAEQELIERHCAPLLAQAELRSMAGLFGGGDLGLDIAAHILELRKGLPPGTLGRKPIPGLAKPPSPTPDQSESNPIKPDQTQSSQFFSHNPVPVAHPPAQRAVNEAGARAGNPPAVRPKPKEDLTTGNCTAGSGKCSPGTSPSTPGRSRARSNGTLDVSR
jgi:hypothetical protein